MPQYGRNFFVKLFLIEALEEIASGVFKDSRFKDEYARNICLYNVHRKLINVYYSYIQINNYATFYTMFLSSDILSLHIVNPHIPCCLIKSTYMPTFRLLIWVEVSSNNIILFLKRPSQSSLCTISNDAFDLHKLLT